MDTTNFSANSTNILSPFIIYPLTAAETWIQLAGFYAFGCGILGTVTNMLVIVAIGKNLELRSRFFTITSFLCGCRFLTSLNLGFVGVQRSFRIVQLMSDIQHSFVCNLFHVWIFNGLTLELMLILFLVIDRIVAIVAPHIYNNMSDAQAVRVCAFLYIFSFVIKTIPAFAGTNPLSNVYCVSTYSGAIDLYSKYIQYLDLVLAVAIILLYLSLISFIYLRVKKKSKNEQSTAAESGMKRQLALVPTLRNQVVFHCGLSLLSKLILLMSGIFLSQAYRLAAWGGNCTAIDILVNTGAILFLNKKIRNAVFDLMSRNRVVPVTSGGMTKATGTTRAGASVNAA